jgi:uncharacterized protein YqjF (DUF2071 family)
VPEDVLLPYVPIGCRLDVPDDEPDLHLVSLVALTFADTRVLRLPVPTAQRFPQVNVRFYVRQEHRRGVVFLRQLVTAPLMMLGGTMLYYQPLKLASLDHDVGFDDGERRAHTRVEYRRHRGAIDVRALNEPALPAPESQETFIKERSWGFYRLRSGASYRYRLSHPTWLTYPVRRAEVTVNPGALTGPEWELFDWGSNLHSVVFAEGSAVTLYSPERAV